MKIQIKQKQRGKKVFLILWLFLTFSLPLFSQDFKQVVFSEADQMRKMALRENAELLAPKSYANGMENYKIAETEFKKEKRLSKIRLMLDIAARDFQNAIQASKIANAAFGNTIQARYDASISDAPFFAEDLWRQAETKLKEAAVYLEADNIRDANKYSGEAESLYRQAELKAIKISFLNEAYARVKEAETLNAKELAPKTLKKAQDLIKDAEKELSENRYDTDVARVLARQARREARHAVYLSTLIQKIKESKLTQEDILLASETPLKRIASTMDINLAYETGFNKSTEDIIKNIQTNQDEINKLQIGIYDAGQLVDLLTIRKDELEARLALTENEKTLFAAKLDTYAKINEQYNAVQAMFAQEEALIFRDGGDIRIRLTGLSFTVGKATIDSKYYGFLGKVINALKLFPEGTVTIEGHTDSFGSDATNLKLSIDRAKAVMDYLLNNAQIFSERMDFIGYGESRPIATNETEEGRGRNRRIAVVIHPNIVN